MENLPRLNLASYHGNASPRLVRPLSPREVNFVEVPAVVELEEIEEVEQEEIEVEESLDAAEPRTPQADGKVPFFKNWIWWVSLVAAVPAGVLVTYIVLGAIDFGGQWNWMMWVVGGITFFCASAALVTPLLLALGFMLGGKEIAGAPAPTSSAASLHDDGFAEDDDDQSDDMFDENEEEGFGGDFDSGDVFDDDFDAEDDFEL